jgi:hypothetical protein
MTESDDVLNAIAEAEATRMIRQVAADQARDHRNFLICDAVDDGLADKASIANKANLSVEEVEEICDRG